jgi:hypothetical protein
MPEAAGRVKGRQNVGAKAEADPGIVPVLDKSQESPFYATRCLAI